MNLDIKRITVNEVALAVANNPEDLIQGKFFQYDEDGNLCGMCALSQVFAYRRRQQGLDIPDIDLEMPRLVVNRELMLSHSYLDGFTSGFDGMNMRGDYPVEIIQGWLDGEAIRKALAHHLK